MADCLLLGLFHEATPTADAIDQLRQLGAPDRQITVMSGTPYTPEMLGRHHVYERLAVIALFGALGGLAVGLFLTVATPLLYPIHVGGQPLVPGPPTLIILFEFTMLGTMTTTFAGLLAESRFPYFGRHVYDYRITEGHIGVLVRLDEALADRAESILKANGAHHMQRLAAGERVGSRVWQRWGLILIVLLIPIIIGELAAYAVFYAPIPDQMVDQLSTAPQEGPRLAAPIAAVSVQGPELIDGQPASARIPADANSLQRGKVLFEINCAMCHGDSGKGNGKLSAFFSPRPADLTGLAEKQFSDDQIFMVITDGSGPMPSIGENLDAQERWDVIDYVRSLQK
jgi:mono/diheme cytochrome c family protein